MAAKPAASVLQKIVSGGQTGVDRAALDAALAAGFPCGGWAPKGRRAEDGVIPERYPLRETLSEDYGERTRHNVRDSDATLVLTRDLPQGGTLLTLEEAHALGRPHLVVNLGRAPDPGQAARWLQQSGAGVLNVAGPRESTVPGIHQMASQFLQAILDLTR